MDMKEKIVLLQELNNSIALVQNSSCVSHEKKTTFINMILVNIEKLLTTEVIING
jgi:hypothetical protein